MRNFFLVVLLFIGLVAFAEGAGLEADASLQALKAGNARFLGGKPLRPNSDLNRVKALAAGQKPYAVILTCSDSRLPPELIFDAGFGELFVVRVAGNVADIDELATIEYGAEHLGAPLVIVLGHSSCGAVTAVVQGAHLEGNLHGLLDNVFQVYENETFPAGIGEQAKITATIKANVLQSMKDILSRSPIVRELEEKGEVTVMGALYDLASGKVEFIGRHPEQAKILAQTASAPTEHGASTSSATGSNSAAYLIAPGAVAAFLLLAFLLFVSANRPFKGMKALSRFLSSFLSVAVACAAIGVNDIAFSGTASSMRIAGLTVAFLAIAVFGICASFSHVRAFKRFFEEAARAQGT